jgi:putative transposase
LACCCASSSTLPTCRTRDGAEAVLHKARCQFPFIERLIADAGYQGPKMTATVARIGSWTLEIVRRCDQHRFVVLPKRWSGEDAGLDQSLPQAREYERRARKVAAFIRLAMIRLILRRLAVSPSH